jgi:hypothetical protein
MRSTNWADGGRNDSDFRVTLAVEDAMAARRAHGLYHRLASRLSADLKFTQRAWGFPDLENSLLRQTATQEAAKSDMIVLALRGDRALPEAVRAWLETLPTLRRSNSAALVVLLEQPDEEQHVPALRDYLRELAAKCRMDLFIHGVRSIGYLHGAFAVESVPVRHSFTPEASLDERPHLRWGINE